MNETQGGVKILLVDDDNFLLTMYSAKFTQGGYTVEACLSGKQALAVLRGGFQPDIILFDLTMPEMDGLAFLKTLTDEHLAPDSIKIALTNQSEDAQMARATELGVARYIVKASMIPSEVVNTVREEIAKRHG